MNSWLDELKELVYAVVRIILGIIILVGGLVILDIIFYIGGTSSTSEAKVAAAFNEGYNQGYTQTYEARFQDAYEEAYDKGYDKGYEIGLISYSSKKVFSRVELRNPTFLELWEFLAEDKTESHEYVKGEYVCYDFAAELNNNAEANGIRAAYVYIRASKWGHAVVGFETVDRGLLFIEPQSDTVVNLVVGEVYPWYGTDAVVPRARYDPILEVRIIW